MLASKNGGMSEMIEHGKSGFVIDPLSPDEISSIIFEYQELNMKLAIPTYEKLKERFKKYNSESDK